VRACVRARARAFVRVFMRACAYFMFMTWALLLAHMRVLIYIRISFVASKYNLIYVNTNTQTFPKHCYRHWY